MQHSIFSVLHPEVRQAIEAERAYQLWKWAGDHHHTVGEWAAVLSCLGDKARYEYTHRHGVLAAVAEIVQLTATGLVALNQHPGVVATALRGADQLQTPQLHPARRKFYAEAWRRTPPKPLPVTADPRTILVKPIHEGKLAQAQGLLREAFVRNADAARMMMRPDTDQTTAEAAASALAAVGNVQILIGDALSALKEVTK